MCQKLDTLHKQVAQHEEKQASKMPRLISNRLKAAIYGETYRMRVDIMKDFQDTMEQQEERWLVKFGKDVLADLHGVCPIIALAAQELLQQQEKLIDSKVKMPALPLNYVPDFLVTIFLPFVEGLELLQHKGESIATDGGGRVWSNGAVVDLAPTVKKI